jgi:hypothetical protein
VIAVHEVRRSPDVYQHGQDACKELTKSLNIGVRFGDIAGFEKN